MNIENIHSDFKVLKHLMWQIKSSVVDDKIIILIVIILLWTGLYSEPIPSSQH